MAGADSVLPPPLSRRAGVSGKKTGRAGFESRWFGLFAILVLTGLASLGLFLFSPEWTDLEGSLPVGMRSPLLADYGVDPFEKSAFAPLSTAILAEALSDRERGDQPAAAQVAEILEDLRTPVPTITPMPSFTPTLPEGAQVTEQPVLLPATRTPAPTAALLRTLAVTQTPGLVFTRTLQPTRTVTPENTASATPSPTETRALITAVVPTAVLPTRAPTETTQPPIFRPSPTSGTINTPLPSRTPEPVFTRTLPPAPTRTPVPPTQVPQPTSTRAPVLPTLRPTLRPEPTEEDPYPPPPPPPPEETPFYPYP